MPSYILKILVLGAMMALAACTDILETGNFREDGVVYRRTVTGPAVARDRGPFCGEDKLVSGIKGVAIPRNAYIPPQDYLIGPGDQLRLNIFGEQGLTDVVATVDNSGFVQLPIIEVVHVADMDTREIHRMLKLLYGEYFANPWITVELAVAESHPIYFLGEFRQSGVGYLKRSTNIIEAIAMGGGLEEDAYLSGARLLRNNTVCTVDLFALLREGDFSQNVAIQGGDAIFAPRKEDMSVYVLGDVASPGAVTYGTEQRSLLESISMAGGLRNRANPPTHVRVVRPLSPVTGELILIDMRAVLNGRTLDFPLEPGDIVYVPRSAVSTWNDSLDQILTSLEFIGGVVTPISLIRTLREG